MSGTLTTGRRRVRAFSYSCRRSAVTDALMSAKFRSVACLVISEIAAMSLWFISAAILPEMLAEVPGKVTITFKRNLRLTKVIWTHAGLHSYELELDGQTNFSS